MLYSLCEKRKLQSYKIFGFVKSVPLGYSFLACAHFSYDYIVLYVFVFGIIGQAYSIIADNTNSFYILNYPIIHTPMSNNVNKFYKFDDFIVDKQHRTLKYKKKAITLTGKTFQLLLFLIENSGTVVTKKQIYAKVWEGKVVSDSTLYKLIQILRNTLDDNNESPKYIQTIHGEGYLFTDIIHEMTDLNKYRPRVKIIKSISILLLTILAIWFFSHYIFKSTTMVFKSIDVEVSNQGENKIDAPLHKGIGIFIKDLLNTGLQNLKSSNHLEPLNYQEKLLVKININHSLLLNNNWVIKLEYIINDTNNISTYDLKGENLDTLIYELITHIKEAPITKELVDGTDEFSKNIDANIKHIYAMGLNQQGDFQKGKSKLVEALQLDNNYPMAKFDLAISERNLSHHDNALAIINNLSKQNHNLFFQLNLSKVKGNIFLNQNRFEEAKEQYFWALELAKNLKLTLQQQKISINLSILYKSLTQYTDSIALIKETIELMEKEDSKAYLGYAYSVLAETYNVNNRTNDSLVQTKKAISVFKSQNRDIELARNYLRLAWLNIKKMNFREAEVTLGKAEVIYNLKKNPIGIENTNFVKFMLALNQNQLSLSLSLLVQQQKLSNNLENDSSLMRFYKAKAFYSQQTHDYDTAFIYYKKYSDLAKAQNLKFEEVMGLLYLVEIEIIRNKQISASFFLEFAMAMNINEIQEELLYRQGLYIWNFEQNKNKAKEMFKKSLALSIKKGNQLLGQRIQISTLDTL